MTMLAIDTHAVGCKFRLELYIKKLSHQGVTISTDSMLCKLTVSQL